MRDSPIIKLKSLGSWHLRLRFKKRSVRRVTPWWYRRPADMNSMTRRLWRAHAALPSAWVAWGANGGAQWRLCARGTVPSARRHLASVTASSPRHGIRGTLVRAPEKAVLWSAAGGPVIVLRRDLSVAAPTDPAQRSLLSRLVPVHLPLRACKSQTRHAVRPPASVRLALQQSSAGAWRSLHASVSAVCSCLYGPAAPTCVCEHSCSA